MKPNIFLTDQIETNSGRLRRTGAGNVLGGRTIHESRTSGSVDGVMTGRHCYNMPRSLVRDSSWHEVAEEN